MAQFPLSPHVPIVDKEGRPTPEFLRWTQTQRDVNEDIIPLGTVGEVSDVLDTLGGDQGSVLYRGAANWQALAPGTAGKVLQTAGAGADPVWASAAATFLGLTDTPSSYSGESGNVVAVKGDESGLEFVAPGGGGGTVTYTVLLTQVFSTTALTTTPVVVTGLDAYDEIIFVINGGTTSGFVLMQFSPDGGTTWRTAGYSRLFLTASVDDYLTGQSSIFCGENGAAIGTYARIRDHNTASIFTSYAGQMGETGQAVSNDTSWYATLEAHDALRIFMGSGTASAGTMYIIGVKY